MPTWAMWLVCGCLVIVRALLAGGESALYGTSSLRAKELAEAEPRRGRRVLRFKTERETTAASIRFGMVVSGFLAASIGALVPPRLLDLTHLDDSALLALVAPLTSALLVGLWASMADVTARSMASKKPEEWALRSSGLLAFTVGALAPPMRLFVAVVNVLLRPFKTQLRFEAPPPPLDELEKLLAARAAKEKLDKGAPQLIRSIFELSDKTCRDVMVPRTEVVAVEMSTPPGEILRILAEESHSRMPVYQEDIDHIAGILHVRDLIPLTQHPELIVLHDLVRPAVFVPWVKPIADLLREMQRQRIHLAIVVDEYGGFMGIVTLEDILREIVGDIGDEFSEELRLVERQPDGTCLVDASISLSELEAATGLRLPEGDYETLGGFITHLAGNIPEVGEKFSDLGWQFVVHAKVGPRLDRLRLLRPRSAAPAKPPQAVSPQ